MVVQLRFHHLELNETVLIFMALYGYARVSTSTRILPCRHKLSALPVVKSSVQKKPVAAAGPEGASCSCCWSSCAPVIR